jgi:hypothetical protein
VVGLVTSHFRDSPEVALYSLLLNEKRVMHVLKKTSHVL